MHRLLAVLVVAVAAILAPVSSPASAAPVQCWTEIDTYKTGQTIVAYAIKDCTHLEAPQNLSLTLEMNVCDQFGCFWVSWISGSGTVSYTCPGTFYAELRSSRLRSKIVHCSYY
jgi:hypothetical protein